MSSVGTNPRKQLKKYTKVYANKGCYVTCYVTKKFMWQTYIVQCVDGTLYAGITTDVKRRMEEHNNSALGSKYTSVRRPAKLVYCKKYKNRSTASKEEWRIKQLSRENKLQLIGE